MSTQTAVSAVEAPAAESKYHPLYPKNFLYSVRDQILKELELFLDIRGLSNICDLMDQLIVFTELINSEPENYRPDWNSEATDNILRLAWTGEWMRKNLSVDQGNTSIPWHEKKVKDQEEFERAFKLSTGKQEIGECHA